MRYETKDWKVRAGMGWGGATSFCEMVETLIAVTDYHQ